MPSDAPSALGRLLRPWEPDNDPAAGRQFLQFEFSEEDKLRSLELSEKANSGEASPAKLAELDDLINANETLMLLQSTARISLRSLWMFLTTSRPTPSRTPERCWI